MTIARTRQQVTRHPEPEPKPFWRKALLWCLGGIGGVVTGALATWATGYVTPLNATLDGWVCAVAHKFERPPFAGYVKEPTILVMAPYGAGRASAEAIADAITRRTGIVAHTTCVTGGGAALPPMAKHDMRYAVGPLRDERNARTRRATSAGRALDADLVLSASRAGPRHFVVEFVLSTEGFEVKTLDLPASYLDVENPEALAKFIERDFGAALIAWSDAARQLETGMDRNAALAQIIAAHPGRFTPEVRKEVYRNYVWASLFNSARKTLGERCLQLPIVRQILGELTREFGSYPFASSDNGAAAHLEKTCAEANAEAKRSPLPVPRLTLPGAAPK